MTPTIKMSLTFFVLFYILFGIYLSVNQERIAYQPSPQDFNSCKDFSGTEKITHNGTRMYVDLEGEAVVVFYHGNGGSACDRFFFAQEFKQAGLGYIFPEYAGYSNDPRRTSHELVKGDVGNVVEYIKKQEIENIIMVAESVGSGAASYHTSLMAPKNMLLISPFASLREVAQKIFWFYPAFLLVDNAFNNSKLLENYTGPITIMHGEMDKIIPQKSSQELYESLISKKKKYISILGVGHNDLFSSFESFFALREFLKSSDF